MNIGDDLVDLIIDEVRVGHARIALYFAELVILKFTRMMTKWL